MPKTAITTLDPESALFEEDPEAFRPADDDGEDEPRETEDREAEDEAPAPAAAHEEVDLVRMYLHHIGKRRLLKKSDEVALGERIEQGQQALLSALLRFPATADQLLAIGDNVRRGDAPVESFVLLPEGGAVSADAVEGVQRALARVKRRRARIETLKTELRTVRGVRRQAALREELAQEETRLGHDLDGQPIRPSVLDDVLETTRTLARQVSELNMLPPAERSVRGRTVAAGTGLALADLRERLADITAAEQTIRQAKNELMEANLRLVVSIAKR